MKYIIQLYPDVYSEVAVAGNEIETYGMAQVHLVCDPYRALEGSSSLAFHAAASARSKLYDLGLQFSQLSRHR